MGRAGSFVTVALLALLSAATCVGAASALAPNTAGAPRKVEVNRVVEIALVSEKSYANPFTEVTLDAIVTQPDRTKLRVPAFWAGANRWCFRYASRVPGQTTWRTECSDTGNPKLHGVSGAIAVVPNTSSNPLYRHGPVRVATDRRHFEHADGTPLFWLGDTWWKGLSKRISLGDFRELTLDRKAKGFTVVQIVAGPYPDEPPFDPRWANEGGMPYEKGYERVNPAYFDYADRRIECLVDAGIVPAIVGGWGWHMPSVGVEKMERHWRYLIARYGAYPVAWLVGGEAGGPEWTEVARYVRATDPYGRLRGAHPYNSSRQSLTDDAVLDFDMLQTGHGGSWGGPTGEVGTVCANTVAKVTSHYSKTPAMPVLVGEVTYEGHMMTNGPDVQRFMFWSSVLNGTAGHTYGAGGLWQMNSEAERGAEYEFTPWSEAMDLPGSTQLGVGKRLLAEYPWWRFAPHPEWVEPHGVTLFEPHAQWTNDNEQFAAQGGRWDLPYAAGIPGEVRVVYIPGHYYSWSAPTVKGLEPNVPYHAFLFNPATGKRYGLGRVLNAGPPPRPFADQTQPAVFEDRFQGSDASAWRDVGSPTRREGGRLVGTKGMVTVVEKLAAADLMAGVDAGSDAEAGVILRYHDADNYLVGLYSPLLKAIYLHDRHNGQWGAQLGRVPVPDVGRHIRLTAAVHGDRAALVMSDGRKTYFTPVVEVTNNAPGRAGLWLYQVGDRQEYADFRVWRAPQLATQDVQGLPPYPTRSETRDLPLVMHENPNIVPAVTPPPVTLLPDGDYQPPRLPAPQDWVLVLERLKP